MIESRDETCSYLSAVGVFYSANVRDPMTGG